MNVTLKFSLWFSVSLVVTFIALKNVGNDYILSFLIAGVLSVLAIQND